MPKQKAVFSILILLNRDDWILIGNTHIDTSTRRTVGSTSTLLVQVPRVQYRRAGYVYGYGTGQCTSISGIPVVYCSTTRVQYTVVTIL